ncbi:cation transporter, partial [Burkholderia multivorans]
MLFKSFLEKIKTILARLSPARRIFLSFALV